MADGQPLQQAGNDPAQHECLSPSPHALLLPYPGQGHINPLLQLGKRLAAQGVRVTLATMQHLHAKLERAQALSSQPSPGENLLQIVAIKDGLPPDVNREVWTPDFVEVVDCTLQEGALELVHVLASEGRPVTCIVGDFFLRWTSSLAQRAALPEFVFWPQSFSTFAIYSHVHALISAGYDPYKNNVSAASPRDASEEIEACIPGFMGMRIHPADLPFESPFGQGPLLWLRESLRAGFAGLGEAQGLLVNSFESLESEVFQALNLMIQQGLPHPQYGPCWPKWIKPAGPIVPKVLVETEEKVDEAVLGASLWQEEVEECMEWLDKQPRDSVLFVAFGSFMVLHVEQVQALASGFMASGQRFLWVIRENGIKSKHRPDAAFQSGAHEVTLQEALPPSLLKGHEGMYKVVRWAPQARVLSHPSVGGFFSHCGWNSTLESLCAGVPILGWPWIMDQVANCWLATHIFKIGLTLERNHDNGTTKEFVEKGVRQLMEGSSVKCLRARAQELRDLACQAARSNSMVSLVDKIKSLATTQNKLLAKIANPN